MDLAQLQTMCKSDALAYKEEFLMQYRHFLSQIQIYKLKPSKEFKPFAHLIKFLSNVSNAFYRDGWIFDTIFESDPRFDFGSPF